MAVNPALAELAPLVGRWRMELYNAAFLPDADARMIGAVEIGWIENGAALRMRQGDAAQPPAAVWIVGRDDGAPDYSVLYADDRGVSRIYRMSFDDGQWRMWRDTPSFSQRFHAVLDPDRSTLRGRWEKAGEAGAWEHDFNLDYIREDVAVTSR